MRRILRERLQSFAYTLSYSSSRGTIKCTMVVKWEFGWAGVEYQNP